MRSLLVLISFLLTATLPAQPNIVLIYVDDLGYGDLGCYGHPIIKSPNLDRLATESLRMTNYYAPSGLCSPSRAGILTGRYPYRSGIKSWIPDGSGIFLSKKETTLAALLKNNGFQTSLIGKWHLNSDLGSEEEPQPSDHGFDYFYGHNAFQIPTNKDPVNIYRNGRLLPKQSGYTAELYANEAMAWIENRDHSRPFFLFLSMAEPHTTIENPAEYNALYREFTDGEINPIPSGEDEIPLDRLVPRGPGEYYANVTYMDAQLGRVLKEIDDQGLRENTIIIFASDNGPVTENWRTWWEVNAHGSTAGLRGRKHTLYEGGIKVPAIIRYPSVLAPGECATLMSGIDVLPTVLGWIGAEPPSVGLDGMDLGTQLEDNRNSDRTLFWSLPTDDGLDHVVRHQNWKLFVDSEGNPRKLFDLKTDPLELIDVRDQEPKIVGELIVHWNRYIRSLEH